MPAPVAIVVKGYPRLSETFIAQELLALQQLGLDYIIYSLRHPHDSKHHPVHDAITAPVVYLPEYLHDDPLRVAASWWRARRLPGFGKAFRVFLTDLRRDPTRSRLRRFGQACVLAAEMPERIERIYVHFLHTPASVGRYCALMRGLPWCCSAHAKDIYTTPDWEKAEKLEAVDWLVTCTEANAGHLRALSGANAGKVSLVYHGLDLDRFSHPPRRDRSSGRPVTILSVGRAVQKKGFDLLIEALAHLPAGLDWRFEHVGGGAETARLKTLAAARGIAGRIAWHGALSQVEVLQRYHHADVFALACRIAADGDRDGLPNVLMEAMSQRLPCLSTRVSAIPELITDEETGLLVEPDDARALAAALERLIRDPDLRERLGEAGEARVRRDFNHHRGTAMLAARFGLKEAQSVDADRVLCAAERS